LKRLVLDASVALSWFLENPVPDYSSAVRAALVSGIRAVVPALWHLEVANTLVVAERRLMLAADVLVRSLNDIEQITMESIDTVNDLVSVRQAITTARTYDVSSYDAVYLDTARHEGLPLATLDRSLRTAAGRAGVELFR
jgi:predicted nucleic acid-binding protein